MLSNRVVSCVNREVALNKTEMSEATRALEAAIAPLKDKEASAAREAATSHLAAKLSKRHRIFGVELRVGKPADSAPPKRQIAVLVVDYTQRRVIEVLTADGSVVNVKDLRGFQPAFLSEEIEEARELAQADERVARILEYDDVFVSAFAPHRSPDNQSRVIGLRYAVSASARDIRILAEAVVDLSERKLVHVEKFETRERN